MRVLGTDKLRICSRAGLWPVHYIVTTSSPRGLILFWLYKGPLSSSFPTCWFARICSLVLDMVFFFFKFFSYGEENTSLLRSWGSSILTSFSTTKVSFLGNCLGESCNHKNSFSWFFLLYKVLVDCVFPHGIMALRNFSSSHISSFHKFPFFLSAHFLPQASVWYWALGMCLSFFIDASMNGWLLDRAFTVSSHSSSQNILCGLGSKVHPGKREPG